MDLFGGISVLWCLNKFTWVACGSLDTSLICHAVDLEDSNFLASCLTLLAGIISRRILESLIVLETNFSCLRKNQNMSLCKIFAVSGGYFPRLIWVCTALYHSSTLFSPCLKLVNNQILLLLHSSEVYRNLQILTKWHTSTILLGQALGYILVYSKIFWPGNNFLAFSFFCKHCKFTFQYVFTF